MELTTATNTHPKGVVSSSKDSFVLTITLRVGTNPYKKA